MKSRCSFPCRVKPSRSKFLILPRGDSENLYLSLTLYSMLMVVGEGFEPSKSMTADLQSAPFGRSGTPPGVFLYLMVPATGIELVTY